MSEEGRLELLALRFLAVSPRRRVGRDEALGPSESSVTSRWVPFATEAAKKNLPLVEFTRSSKHCEHDVAGIGFPTPPSAFGALGVFRHSRVSRVLANPVDHFLELGSPSETLPGTALFGTGSCESDPRRLLPWTSLPVQRSRQRESDSRPDIPSPAPSPLGVSHALRGFILSSPCHRVADG